MGLAAPEAKGNGIIVVRDGQVGYYKSFKNAGLRPEEATSVPKNRIGKETTCEAAGIPLDGPLRRGNFLGVPVRKFRLY